MDLLSRGLRTIATVALASSAIAMTTPESRQPTPAVPEELQSPIVLANASGDRIQLEGTSLMRQRSSTLQMISSERSAAGSKWELADGSFLRVDKDSPEGTYTDVHGDPIHVLPGSGFPRYVDATLTITRVLSFAVQCSARVGYSASLPGQAITPELFLQAMAAHGWSRPLADEDSLQATECAEDGPTRYSIWVSPSRRRPIVVTWFAYAGDGLPKATDLRRVGNRVEWSITRATPARLYPVALQKPVEAAAIRVVGSVLIDPVANTIRRLP